jgi:hypothetical protein
MSPPSGMVAEPGTAGLPRIRFHDPPPTTATLLLSAQVNPKAVSEMLGHATIRALGG